MSLCWFFFTRTRHDEVAKVVSTTVGDHSISGSQVVVLENYTRGCKQGAWLWSDTGEEGGVGEISLHSNLACRFKIAKCTFNMSLPLLILWGRLTF